MSLAEFIGKYIPLSTDITVFPNAGYEQLFEGKANEIYKNRYGYSEDDTLCEIGLRDVAEIEPDPNYPGWLVITVD